MSLNNIRLTPQLLADLYGNVLIETNTQAAPEASLKFLGGNEKNILVVVKSEGAGIVPEAELAFLKSILTACKLQLDDVAILNWNMISGMGYKQLLQELESRFILLFDLTPAQFGLPMDFPPFQVQAFDTRQYLYAPALEKIKDHKGLKGELWAALKKLFML
jgi:DNA polymerase III psi subunit